MTDPSLLSLIDKFVLDASPVVPGPMLGSVAPLEPHWQFDAPLQAVVEDICTNRHPEMKEQCFAVVDLTADSTKPAYAGWNDRRQVYVASLAKLLVLFSAFQLRADLSLLSMMRGITDPADLFAQGRKLLAGLKAAQGRRPLLEDLFELPNPGRVEFKTTAKTDAELMLLHASRSTPNGSFAKGVCPKARYGFLRRDKAVQDELATLPVHEQLRLMVGWSDNVAAGVNINAIGHPYIWALAKRSGLVQTWPLLAGEKAQPLPGPTGLCVVADYAGGPWQSQPADLPPLRYEHACARSVAALMTMMARDELVGAVSSAEMREMIRRDLTSFGDEGERGESAPLGRGIATAGPPLDGAFAKIGLDTDRSSGTVTEVSNAVICHAPTHAADGSPKPLHLVAVGLINPVKGVMPDKPKAVLELFGVEIVLELVRRNGLRWRTSP